MVLLCALVPQLLAAGTGLPGADTRVPAPENAVALYLDVEVNGQSAGRLVRVEQRGADFTIDAETLRSMQVRNTLPPGTPVTLSELPGVGTRYDRLAQKLFITVPPEWLPLQRLAEPLPEQLRVGTAGTGWFMNYDLYSRHTRQHSQTSLWSEQRFFNTRGVGYTTGLARLGAARTGPAYVRYDTRWTHTDAEQATETLFGDIVTGALPWTGAVRLGGLQWARNFRTRPDLVTYPMPEFSGVATVPSAVDVFVNGFRAASHQVAPGPFTMGEIPVVHGAGTASVVTTDALGRQVATTFPFYVNRELLRPGLTDYSLSVGALRRDYGLRSFAYGKPIAAGVYREGLTQSVTLEAQAQVGKGLRVIGAGAVATLGLWGVGNASITQGATQRSGTGWQYSAGWQYSSSTFSASFQQTGRDARFGDASTYANDGYGLPRRTRQATVGWTLAKGSFTAGWIDLIGASSPRSRIAYASYSAPMRQDLFLSVTAGRTLETGDTQLRLQLTYLLGQSASAQVAAVRSRDSTQAYAAYQQNVPTEGGWGWNVSHATASAWTRNSQAAVQYRNNTLTVQGGISDSAGQSMQWLGLAGAVGSLDGHVFMANRIHDSFALVSTQGMPNVPILYENQLAGYTDDRGYLLIPSVPAYYASRYAINPLPLPADVHIPVPERRVAPPRGAGMLVELPVLKMHTATLTLVDEHGAPLPPGSAVVHDPDTVQTVVGWDGLVYLTKLHPRNTLAVRTPQGTSCNGRFTAADYVATRDLVVRCLEAPTTKDVR
jgi:outer membrane usher protein